MRQSAGELSVFYRDKNRTHDDIAYYTCLVAVGVVETYGKNITPGSRLAFHLYEARRGRNHLRSMDLAETQWLRIVWRLGRMIDERLALLEGKRAPKSVSDSLEAWHELQRLAQKNIVSRDPLTRQLVKRVQQLPMLSADHYDPKLEQQIFSAQKFWPDTGAR